MGERAQPQPAPVVNAYRRLRAGAPTFGRRDHRLSDARVAAGEVDEGRIARRGAARLLSFFDHVERDAVLERASRVAHLELGQHPRGGDALGQALGERDEWRVPDRVEVGAERRRRGLPPSLEREQLRHPRERVGRPLLDHLLDDLGEGRVHALALEVGLRVAQYLHRVGHDEAEKKFDEGGWRAGEGLSRLTQRQAG